MTMMTPENPLYRFHYCPLCGGGQFEESGENVRRCADCGFAYYANPRGATVALIVNARGELLVGRRTNEPARGTLDLVGGFVDLGETAEEALCREIFEESGLRVDASQLRYLFSRPNIYPFSGINVHTLDLFFEIRLADNPVLRGSDDIDGLHWVPLHQVDASLFGLRSVREGVTKYLHTNE